ncbi:sugar transferase [Flavobacteriaceae bacterium]|nr:sugar transferase [Flavobacteriaceae bacterium]MDB2631950.1 sugar transferase [Flavobacteriaceae bacterium]
MYKQIIKRLLDLILAIIALVFFLPLILLITITLLVANKGEPFFVQRRVGENEKIFKIFKFKTMNNLKTKTGELLPDAQRLTGIGRLLRQTSLDELPQLYNVLIGTMSFVGPRPLLTEYLPLYSKFQKQRHNVKPGITGWAQINGRNMLSWQDKFNFDVWYVKNLSFLLDFKILAQTILKVIQRKGINKDGNSTMEYFKGNDNL